MPWDQTRAGTAAKYRTAEHRRERARHLAHLKRVGSVECAQPVCVMPSRTIYDGEPVHLGHDDDGITYIGLVHPLCNVKDGARRGRARQNATSGRRNATRWTL